MLGRSVRAKTPGQKVVTELSRASVIIMDGMNLELKTDGDLLRSIAAM